MGTTINGDTGVIFPDASTQSKAVSVATPFAITASAISGAELQFFEATANGVNYVAVKAPNALAANTTFTLPAADGTNGQFLQTNGSGTLAFASTPATTPGGTTGQIQFNNAGVFGGVTAVGVANGGTGATTLPANNVLIGNGTSAVQTVAPGTTGNLLTSNGTSWASSAPSGPTLQATLSGTLADGSRVIVNPDGTVTPAQGPTELLGSAVIFSSSAASQIDSTYDTANQKIVIVYRNDDNLYYAAVGTVSETTISFGTPVTFANSLGFLAVCRITYHAAAQKVVIAYVISGSGYAVVGTVSGTSISFGAQASMPFTFTQNNNGAITYDSTNQKIVVVSQSSTFGSACVGTVSGTSISFGSAVNIFPLSQVSSATTALCFDPSTSKVVVVSARSGNGFAAVVGTVSGTSISFGAEVTFGFNGSASPQNVAMAYDSLNQKVAIFYKISFDAFLYGVIATIAGTNISVSSATGGGQATDQLRFTACYDVLNNVFCVAYINPSNFMSSTFFRISSGILTYVTGVNFTSGATDHPVVIYDPIQQREVVAYNLSSRGRAAVFRYGTTTTNVTAENFIGFSNGAYTNGQTATIQIIGSVDDAQSGLTPGQSYYVQTDGTLGLTPASPSVFAGTAVSATKIIVKG